MGCIDPIVCYPSPTPLPPLLRGPGADADAKRLVVGVIDYVREYSIDKQMEYLVKASGVMGGGRAVPGIQRSHFFFPANGFFWGAARESLSKASGE